MTSQICYYYTEGRTDYFTIRLSTGEEVHFAGQVPVYFATKYAARIFACSNCQKYGYFGGSCIGMCANCGFETDTQKGFINYVQECEDELSAHLPSVFDTYLSRDYDLKRVGDKYFVNTIHIMVNDLCDYLLDKFGYEKQSAILGLRAYLRSLDHEPRHAVLRINDLRNISKKQLICRNWAHVLGPHFDANGDYIGGDTEDEEEDEEEQQCPETTPVLMRTDTEYHYWSCNSEVGDSEVDYFMFLSDRRRGMSMDSNEDDDAVSEISVCEVEEQEQEQLQEQEQEQLQEQEQEQEVQVMEDAC